MRAGCLPHIPGPSAHQGAALQTPATPPPPPWGGEASTWPDGTRRGPGIGGEGRHGWEGSWLSPARSYCIHLVCSLCLIAYWSQGHGGRDGHPNIPPDQGLLVPSLAHQRCEDNAESTGGWLWTRPSIWHSPTVAGDLRTWHHQC